jgi:hypothetical protein
MSGRHQLQVAARCAPLAFGKGPALPGIIAVLWSWRNCFCSRGFREFSGAEPKHWVCVTHTLTGEYVGLEETDDGLWDV